MVRKRPGQAGRWGQWCCAGAAQNGSASEYKITSGGLMQTGDEFIGATPEVDESDESNVPRVAVTGGCQDERG